VTNWRHHAAALDSRTARRSDAGCAVREGARVRVKMSVGAPIDLLTDAPAGGLGGTAPGARRWIYGCHSEGCAETMNEDGCDATE